LLNWKHYLAIALITVAVLVLGSRISLFPKTPVDVAALRRQADQGDVDAQYQIALRFENGDGIGQSFDQAGAYLDMAANRGDARARAALQEAHATCAKHDPKTLDEAHACQIDAQVGDRHAQISIAVLYSSGRLFEKNEALAALWFDVAAIHGDPWAQAMMARVYAGHGLPENPVEEYAWAATAAQRTDLPDAMHQQAVILQEALKIRISREFGPAVFQQADDKARFYIEKYGKSN